VTQHEPPDWFTELAHEQDRTEALPTVAIQSPTEGSQNPSSTERPPRRRRWRGRIIGITATVLVIAVGATYASLTLNAPVGAAAVVANSPTVARPAATTITLPQVGEGAVSISGADDFLGPTADVVYASSGGNAPLPMASISKLVTALVVLGARPLGASGNGPTITWSKADSALYDKYFVLNATIAAMKNGSSMSEHDALETMLVVSACNYAEAMADWAFGSNAGFVSATKRWLKAHGLTGTTMVEPTGLDDRNTSTPSDLIAIGKLAMADPNVAAIVAKTSLDVPALQGMISTNDLLGSDGVNGIKTGTLDTAGSDLLFSAVVPVGTPQPLNVIGVVLGGQSRGSVNTAVLAMIDSIKAGFHVEQFGLKGQVVGSYSTPWGAKATMVLSKSASALTWSNTPITSTITTTALKFGASGQTVGSVTWKAGTTTITVPVVLQGKIAGPSSWWRLTHPAQLLGK
jgi:serine-type D-Ala-D-Ala carboxypeptidase (penicillin-binding protein 5/6)